MEKYQFTKSESEKKMSFKKMQYFEKMKERENAWESSWAKEDLVQ